MAPSRHRAAGRVPSTPTAASDSQPESAGTDALSQSALPFPVVCIGASAGGLEAFTQLLSALPTDTGMAFVLVSHLSPSHTSHLAEILSRATRMPVTEVKDEPRVQPNCVYVMPPDSHMTIVQGSLKLVPRHKVEGRHHPIDLFLESLALDQKHKSVAVILSGTGSDGTLGMDEIKAAGGITFAQEESAAYEGMPRSAMMAGTVDFRLSPADIARELGNIARHAYVGTDGPPERIVDGAQAAQILRLLHHDILINVTSFFRDPETFELLKTRVFPRIIGEHGSSDAIRMWVVGCSTGEEAYSLAIVFSEFMEREGRTWPVQIFATDLNGPGIERARNGLYPRSSAERVSPERLRRYFYEVDGNFRVAKAIRDLCVFAKHNVLVDPPFSRMDVITCRNMLIYLEPVLQQHLMPTLHYALKSSGVLLLGGSESTGAFGDLFDPIDGKHRFYGRKPNASRLPPLLIDRTALDRRRASQAIAADARRGEGAGREADRILLARYTPPGVLVTEDLEILQFHGDTGAYLTPLAGKASLNLVKMLREGLLAPIRGAIARAKKDGAAVRKNDVRLQGDGQPRSVDIEVVPVKGAAADRGGFLVLFHQRAAPAPRAPRSSSTRASENELEQLKQELAATKDYLQSVIEQQEAANEELQSANEEVQSANEELQSINEEIETSKEEMESSNEELATVNEELQNRNAELGRSNNDLMNLLASVQMAIVMLGHDLRIRRFTPMAETMLNLIPTDVGRPLSDIKLNVDVPDLDGILVNVLENAQPVQRDVQDRAGRWYSLRVRPYRTAENRIDGAVIALVDIDSIKTTSAMTAP